MSGQSSGKSAEHPGTLLRCIILPALHLSVSRAAQDLLITRQTLHRILACKAAITPDMAVRLQKLCGISSGFWLERQQLHEIDRARQANRDILPRIPSRTLPEALLKDMGLADAR